MIESKKVLSSKRKVLSLPLDLWPEADRIAWIAACQPARRLKRGGSAGHLKPVTREDHAGAYGNFLGFLERCGLLGRDGPAAANVTPDRVDAYVDELKRRVGSLTLHGAICKLRRAAQYITPGRDFTWLAEIGKDLALVARPRSKFDRLVLSEVLVEAGLTLIREANDSQNMTKLARARQVRNGLMVAMLALCPIRRKNFTALEIGRTFVNIRGKWWIVLPASETKERRADERPIDDILTAFIDRYLAEYRPVLARSDNPSKLLWLSQNDGSPLSGIRAVISGTTLATVGVPVSPHLFRTAGASSAAIHAGDHPHLGAALLDHTDPRVTNAHYNRAGSFSAGERLRQVLRNNQKPE
jgi:integrase